MMILPIGEMSKSKAFSLVEILLVLIIIGIVVALAAPNFSKGYAHFQLDKTADDLLSVSRWAQAMSMGQERVYALSFSQDHRSYNLVCEKSDEDNVGEDVFEPVKGALGRMHVIPDTIRFETQADRIKFYPDGTIDRAEIKLESSNQEIKLSSALMRGLMTKVDSE